MIKLTNYRRMSYIVNSYVITVRSKALFMAKRYKGEFLERIGTQLGKKLKDKFRVQNTVSSLFCLHMRTAYNVF